MVNKNESGSRYFSSQYEKQKKKFTYRIHFIRNRVVVPASEMPKAIKQNLENE